MPYFKSMLTSLYSALDTYGTLVVWSCQVVFLSPNKVSEAQKNFGFSPKTWFSKKKHQNVSFSPTIQTDGCKATRKEGAEEGFAGFHPADKM